MDRLVKYFYGLKLGKAMLWCYLIWYLVTGYFHFDSSPKIWLNSIGMSALIGTGLLLSVEIDRSSPEGRWQIFRLYLMPFCVSSFSALIKDRGFYIFVSPQIYETSIALLGCAVFGSIVYLIKITKTQVLDAQSSD